MYEPYLPLEWSYEESSPRQEVMFSEPTPERGMAFPVVEVPDPNNAGQFLRQHAALSFKELKGLKEAVSAYGPLAPFTSTIFESYATSNLTP